METCSARVLEDLRSGVFWDMYRILIRMLLSSSNLEWAVEDNSQFWPYLTQVCSVIGVTVYLVGLKNDRHVRVRMDCINILC